MILRVTVCDNPIQPNFMEIGRFQLQHLVDPLTIDLVRSIANFFRSAISSAKPSLDQFLTILIQEVEGVKMGAS